MAICPTEEFIRILEKVMPKDDTEEFEDEFEDGEGITDLYN